MTPVVNTLKHSHLNYQLASARLELVGNLWQETSVNAGEIVFPGNSKVEKYDLEFSRVIQKGITEPETLDRFMDITYH
jgi:hypothetical protein